jgi:choline dehydrogenase-like flavoprotein
MLPRNKSGVVSPELLVYGTSNLRVVDLSIMPIHFAAHAQTTAYVIGEKGALFIVTFRSAVVSDRIAAADIIRGLSQPYLVKARY